MADEEELSPEDVAWQQFLHPGERILLTSLVWKRKGSVLIAICLLLHGWLP